MTNNKYTPQGLSKKLAELGIKVESEFVYASVGKFTRRILKQKGYGGAEIQNCYTLSDLPEVLKAVGEKKDWGYTFDLDEKIPLWKFCFVEMSRLYSTSPDEAWQYLEDLLDNK